MLADKGFLHLGSAGDIDPLLAAQLCAAGFL